MLNTRVYTIYIIDWIKCSIIATSVFVLMKLPVFPTVSSFKPSITNVCLAPKCLAGKKH